MLLNSIQDLRPTHLTTYTRNPAVLKMIDGVSDAVYPLDKDEELRQIAAEMPHATDLDAIYQINRYPEQGLFRGTDPADTPYEMGQPSLKESFPLLISARNALIVTSRIRKDLV